MVLLPVLTRLRLELAEHDQHRIADLTMVLYVAVAASLVGTDGLRLGVHESLVWLPGVVLPLLIAQTMCVEGRVPMTALFRYLRKMKARGQKIRDGYDESHFLSSIEEVVARGTSLSEELLRAYHTRFDGSVEPVFSEFAY